MSKQIQQHWYQGNHHGNGKGFLHARKISFETRSPKGSPLGFWGSVLRSRHKGLQNMN